MSNKYNDFKTYTVKGKETVQDICFSNNISESDLAQANPHIPLASYGGWSLFGPKRYQLDIKKGDVLKIPFYNKEKDKKGVKTIKGKTTVKVGDWEDYKVTEWYEGTPIEDRNESKVKWKLYHLQNGTKPKSLLNMNKGKIRFNEVAVGNKYKIVGYLHEPELNSPSAMLVNVEASEKKEIIGIKISDINNQPIKGVIAYGQTINVHVETSGMKGEYLHVSLWEDDANGGGHSDSNKHNLIAEEKVLIGNKGIAFKQFVLKPDFKKIANAYLSKGDSSEGSTHEYYVTAYASGESKASPNINVRNPDYQEKRKEETQDHLNGVEQPPKNESTQPSDTPIVSETVKAKADVTKVEVAESTTVAKVADSKPVASGVEALVDAYFAKEEFKKETSEAAGQHKYTFQNPNKEVDKKIDEIAGIIKKRVDEKVKAEKKYTKLDDIKNALTQKSYAAGTSISINLYKLGPEYVKINNAPLEEEVYVVAKTANLDGKEVTIKIKEKETVLVEKDADVKVLEAKENGNEITELKAKAENGIAKVKVKLRPKSDEDLKTWKEKLKGIKDGTHTYTFASKKSVTKDDADKKKIAGIILKKVNESLSAQKKFVKLDDIIKALSNEFYTETEQITFDVYKEITEYLWLKAECTGDVKKHEGEFLKRDGSYFVIKGKCGCEIDEDFFFTNYNKEFPNKDRNNNVIPISEDTKTSLKKMFLGISEYYSNEKRCCNLKHIAYMLATAKLETANTFNPINEYGGNSYFESMYDPILGKNEDRKQMAKDNENTTQGDGVKYHGRGFVQLTWKKNYRKMKEKFGVDLINNPEKALEHELAMKIMIYGMENGSFTGKKLTDYIDANKKDYLNARRIINGTDRASDIKDYAEKIEKCLKFECNCRGSNSTESNVNINFEGQTANQEAVSQMSRGILEEIGRATNNLDIYITSTARTPHDQARIMYDNCQADLQEQRDTYRPPGQRVIDVYVANKNKARNIVISLMEAKINELGPSTVSLHCADSNTINVFDISIRRLSNPNDFLSNLQNRSEVSQVLIENNVYHVEIPQ